MKYHVSIDSTAFEMELEERNGRQIVKVDGAEVAVDFCRIRGRGSYSLLVGDASYPISFEVRPDGLSVTVAGESYLARVEDERTRAARAVRSGGGARDAEKVILSMMPGIVRDVRVAAGDEVEAGRPLLILEAMKMENALAAPCSGTLKAINFASGDSVAKGAVLAVIG